MQTLGQFVKAEGSPERAAYKIGVAGMTVRRWLKNGVRPNSRPIKDRLKTLKIKIV